MKNFRAKLKVMLTGCLLLSLATTFAQVKWEVASWQRAMGSHRALIQVDEKADMVAVTIPWRRSDSDAEKRNLILVDLTTGKRIINFATTPFNREEIELLFEPATIPGKYAFYYLPLQKNPKARLGQSDWMHMPYKNMAEQTFLERAGLSANRYLEVGILEDMPRAKLLAMQARTQHDSFYPMGVIATENEVAELKNSYASKFILFPEDRKFPIAMTDFLPQRWIENLPQKSFTGVARKGEYYAFQVGVFASQQSVRDMKISWGDFVSASNSIKKDKMEIINRDIVDIFGKKSTRKISVEQNKVQPLWFIISVPENAEDGKYVTEISFADGGEKQKIKFILNVQPGPPIELHGTLDNWRVARLKWLNSAVGISENIPAPYSAVKVKNNVVDSSGKVIAFSASGYPSSIKVYGHEVLAAPVRLDVKVNGRTVTPATWKLNVKKENNRIASVNASSYGKDFEIINNVRTEYDGYMFFNTVITARKDIKLSDINVIVPYRREVAKYMMGFDIGIGGLRPKNVNWKWQNRPNNKAWIGNVNAGLRIKLRGDKQLENIWTEVRPEVNGIPQSWSNNGKGGAKVYDNAGHTEVMAYTGDRILKKGESLEINFSLLPTPVKPRDPETYLPKIAFSSRTGFLDTPFENKVLGTNNAVMFHGTSPNPCINYPLYRWQKILDWSQSAVKIGQKPWLYYKVGELSNFSAEIMALKSLNDEILSSGNRLGDAWLVEHLGNGNFSPRWCAMPFGNNGPYDASVDIKGGSRWDNFYMNSLEILIKKCGIRGLYFDGLGYSRYFMQRLRSVVNDYCQGDFLLDFHCGNTITRRSNTYLDVMEHLPYFDTTWIGEGFNYDRGPDFYMVELSGIPFGVPNSMLQYGGNQYRGLLYGMTTRPLGNHTSNPSHLWKFFDRVNIGNARLIGYWEEENCPVKTDNAKTLGSVYKFPDGKALIAVATWSGTEVKCNIKVDWKKLGINPAKVIVYTPQIPAFQDEKVYDLSKPVTIPGGKGFLFMVEPVKSLKKVIGNFDDISVSSQQDMSKAEISKILPNGGSVNLSKNMIKVTGKKGNSAFAYLPLPENAIGVSCKMRIKNPSVRELYDWHKRWDGLISPGFGVYCENNKKDFRINEASHGVWAIDDMLFGHMYYIDPNWRTQPKDAWIHVRIFWNNEYIVAETSKDGKNWNIIYALQKEVIKEPFKYVKLGKMPKMHVWPYTRQEVVSGPEQSADYTDLKFYYKK